MESLDREQRVFNLFNIFIKIKLRTASAKPAVNIFIFLSTLVILVHKVGSDFNLTGKASGFCAQCENLFQT